MGTILLVGIVLSSPILSFIVLILVLGMIGVIAQIVVDLLGNALDAAKARIKKLFVEK
jgi:signal transduction histidine kinase